VSLILFIFALNKALDLRVYHNWAHGQLHLAWALVPVMLVDKGFYPTLM